MDEKLMQQNAQDEGTVYAYWASRTLIDSEQKIEMEQSRNLLHGLLEKISDDYRTAVILRYQEELSYQEIAEVLGISVNLAKVRVHRGIEKLRILFQNMENKE